MFQNRRFSDYVQMVLLSIVLVWAVITVFSVALHAQTNGNQQQFNARTETRIEQLERYRDAIEDLNLQDRLARLESRMQDMTNIGYTTIAIVGALAFGTLWQVMTAYRQRK